MKKWLWILGMVVTWEVLLSPTSAICGFSTTVAYTLSVTIPEHPIAPVASQTSQSLGQTLNAQPEHSATKRITEETVQDHQRVRIETFVVK